MAHTDIYKQHTVGSKLVCASHYWLPQWMRPTATTWWCSIKGSACGW